MDHLPKLPADFLEVNYDVSERPQPPPPAITQIPAPLPFAMSDIFWAEVLSADQLTYGDDVKTVYDLILDMKDFPQPLKPGDTLGIFPRNNKEEVENLLSRLRVKDHMDVLCHISLKAVTSKKKPSIPSHLPPVSTLREIFESCLDLHAVPKKLFIRALLEYTSDPKDHQSLRSLCHRNSETYSDWILSGQGYLEALLADHPSCLPPINVILEHLPRLLPRPYSVAYGNPYLHIHIAVSVTEFILSGVQKTGVCSGWLEKVTEPLRSFHTTSDLVKDIAALSLNPIDKPKIKIPVFKRATSNFHYPNDLSRPLIMIGAGVGVAPFVGFLQQREQQLLDANFVKVSSCWLFHGCRYPYKDMLYCEEFKRYEAMGLLDEYVLAHSRDRAHLKYVQENIKVFYEDFCHLILEQDGYVYVCGDAAGMARNVLAQIVDSIAQYKGISRPEAMEIVMQMQAAGRYKEDVWTLQDDVVRMYTKAMAADKERQAANAVAPPERAPAVCDVV